MTLSGKSWQQRQCSVPAVELPGVPGYLQQIFLARGVTAEADLDYSLKTLPRPELFKDMDRAVQLLINARQQQTPILIVGDYDADGATSSAVLLLGLQALGFTHIDYLVPDRFTLGYGLTPQVVELALSNSSFKPGLLLTVDNGISSIEGVKAAKAAGLQVLVTDHHLPGSQLPDSDAILNPNQPGCEFPGKNLAGVGVAFYLLVALRAELAKHAENDLGNVNLAGLLDLVAIGTVADLVKMDKLNRTLVAQGIARIRAGQTRLGVLDLLRLADKDHRQLTSTDIGFVIGPRLNAAGRMDDMSLGIECLVTENPDSSRLLAAQLDKLNYDRRKVEGGMREQAEKDLAALESAEDLPNGLALYRESWHEGVVGIVAGRLKEKFHRPVVAFANSANGQLKGSARSVPGIHIRDMLADIHSQNPGLIERFGGHAMAAGLSLEQSSFDQFQQAFAAQMELPANLEKLQQTLWHDGNLPQQYLTMETAQWIETAGPWGQAFEEPVFTGVFKVLNFRVLKEKHLKLQLETHGQNTLDAIAFNLDVDHVLDRLGEFVGLAFNLSVNEFRGFRTVQLLVRDMDFEPDMENGIENG